MQIFLKDLETPIQINKFIIRQNLHALFPIFSDDEESNIEEEANLSSKSHEGKRMIFNSLSHCCIILTWLAYYT